MPADPVAPPSDGVFTVGRRGYDPHQVDAHLRRLDAEIRILVADRDAAVDQAAQLGRDLEEARLRADRLRTQVRTMAARPSDVQGMSERMRTMLRLAEDEVADMLRRADAEVARRLAEADRAAEQVTGAGRREADRIVFAARSDAQASLDEATRHRAETDQACASDRRSLAEERAAAEHAIALAGERAEQERTSAWAESERRRATVEEDFSLAMDQRRAEALAAIQAERAQSEQWAQGTRAEATRQARAEITAAEETARRLVAEAQARVEELADVRSRIAAQLRGTQSQLSTAIDSLAPEALPPAVPAPAVGAAPAPPAVEAAPAAPAVESVPQPPALPAAPDVPSPPAASADDPVEPVTQPVPTAEPDAAVLDVPEQSDPAAGEARRPTQRRRKRQNSGSRR